MNHLADYLTNYLLRHDIIKEESVEEYIYGFQMIIGKLFNCGTLLIMSACNRNLIPTMLFMLVLFGLRSRTGGYHAKTPTRCYVTTVICYMLIVNVIAPIVDSNRVFPIAILTFSSIVIFTFAPINHPNLELDEIEMKACRRSFRCIVLLLVGCMGIAYILSVKSIYITYSALGLGLDAVSICIAKLVKQEVMLDEGI